MDCKACGNWGQKDHGTVKVDMVALQARDKENAAHPNIMNGAGEKANVASKEEQEKARQQKEWETKQALKEWELAEQERKVMELRVKEENERLQVEQQAEEQRQEAERQRLLMEQMLQREEQFALQQKQEQERKLAEEAEKARRLQEEEEQKKIHAWLQANGFKETNQLVRKMLSKVTPLQCAIQQKNVEMMMLLLRHGADASKVNGKNESALTVAEKMNKKGSHQAVVQALMEYQKYVQK